MRRRARDAINAKTAAFACYGSTRAARTPCRISVRTLNFSPPARPAFFDPCWRGAAFAGTREQRRGWPGKHLRSLSRHHWFAQRTSAQKTLFSYAVVSRKIGRSNRKAPACASPEPASGLERIAFELPGVLEDSVPCKSLQQTRTLTRHCSSQSPSFDPERP